MRVNIRALNPSAGQGSTGSAAAAGAAREGSAELFCNSAVCDLRKEPQSNALNVHNSALISLELEKRLDEPCKLRLGMYDCVVKRFGLRKPGADGCYF